MPSRPQRFDETIAARFVANLRGALSDGDAAVHAGVDEAQIERWRRSNRSFDAAIRRSKAEAGMANAIRVRQAAAVDWRAALALVEHAAQEREVERLRLLTTDARA